jgi:hypothetical protein
MMPVNVVSVIRKRPKPGQTTAAPPPAPAPVAAPPLPPPPKKPPSFIRLYGNDDDTVITVPNETTIDQVVLYGKDYPNLNFYFDRTNTIVNDDVEMVFISPGYKVTFFEHANFQGNRITLPCGSYEFIDDSENEISSLKVEDDGERICASEFFEIYDWLAPAF